MKSKFLTLLCSFLVLFSVNAHAFTLNDATSFNPEQVQVQAASIGVPIGTVIVWTQEEIPEGWLECNGQPVPDIYPDLKAVMPNVPNYQGMFLRGAGNQVVNHGNYGSIIHGTQLGAIQSDTIRNIYAEINYAVAEPSKILGAFSPNTYFDGYRQYRTAGRIELGFKFDTSQIVPTSEENRPVNIGVKYIIKAE